MRKAFIYIILFLLETQLGFAQNVQQNTMQQKPEKIVQESKKLQSAYDANDDYAVAKSYEAIGNEYYKNADYKKAEENFLKAKALYVKLNKKQDKTRVTRLLAKSQEAQNKTEDAIRNYQEASGEVEPADKAVSNASNTVFSKDNTVEKRKVPNSVPAENVNDDQSIKADEAINLNDAARLRNQSNPVVQEQLLQSNIDILAKSKDQSDDKNEIVNSYSQLAKVQLQQNKIPEAIQNYNNAFVNAKGSENIVNNGNQLSNTLAKSGDFKKAIQVQKEILNKPEIQHNSALVINQMQNLATIYVQNEDNDSALILLEQSYDLAIQHNKTMDAKNSLEAMVKIFNDKGNTNKSIALYQQFLASLESLIQQDSSLIDTKILQATEEKISQLEQEKKLKDELIQKKNTFNYFLIAASILLLLLLFFIGKSLYSIKIKNKKIELQSLRREMNPHFVFNSLNSINQFISQNNELEANKYLSSYSNLMRSIMENSNKDFISLSTELELITRYLDLEKLRFSDKFDYKISVDELIDTDAIQIPNMLIQPHLENAIWHGLRYKETKGNLLVNFLLHDNAVVVKIEDDGIGLTQSKALKTKNQQSHKSIGINNTQNRIKLLNELYHKNIECKINELQQPNQGTVVKITFDV